MVIKKGMKFDKVTVEYWQSIWGSVLTMAHTGVPSIQELRTEPTNIHSARFFLKNSCQNQEELSLDFSWKKFHGPLHVVPEFTYLYVPRALFHSLGIYKLFEYCFPNCTVEFWPED